ncbi:MAG TPA: polysaccharide pyruvyl transferase family protein [Anaerohalosphaeraceae bacterium]|nr:polysaccharide pyruvyl transferase family protein [Anaerohalosphaeraceae bacterium]
MMENDKPLNIMIVGGNYIGKGAEAMMLVVRDQISRRYPNANFWLIPNSADEAEKLKQDGFKLIYQKKGRRFIKLLQLLCGFLGIQQKTGLSAVESGQSLINPFMATDAVVDISGFVSSDQIGGRAAKGRWLNYMWAAYAGNKIFFMPQSWGPFENKTVRRFTKWLLKKASFICAREKISFRYLIDSGCAKANYVLHSYDIAFLFDVHGSEKRACDLLSLIGLKDSNLPFITITPNMRIYERVQGKDGNNKYIALILEIIRYFLDHTDHNVILIPHEASLNRPNDPELCMLLKELARNPDRVAMLTGKESALEVKSVIGQSDFLVASRYHSLVAALSMRTPVAVIGWSHKYDELMQVVGLSDYVIDPVRNLENKDVIEMVKKAYQKRQEIAFQLKEKLPLIENNVHVVFEKIMAILDR